MVLCWCARFGGPGIDPEDAAHDVFVVVLDRLPSLRDPVAFPAWLYRVTRRVVGRYRRSAWWRRIVRDTVLEPRDPAGTPETRVGDAEIVRQAFALLEALPADLSEVLLLCDVERRSEAEAAALIGIPTGTVKSRLFRARRVFAAQAARRGFGKGRLVDPTPETEP